MADNPGFPRFWLGAALVSGVLVVLLMNVPRIPTYEVARQRSPDGWYDAVLMAVPRDAKGAHSYWVCLQGARAAASTVPVTKATCSEVAYLAGVLRKGLAPPVTLVWVGSSQLEIRYANATSIHMYKSVFGTPRGVHRPIFMKALRTDGESGTANHQ